MSSFRISFEPPGRQGRCRSDRSLLDCARELGTGVVSVCGGLGTCRSCKVKVLEGPVSTPTSKETDTLSRRELDEGWRLACQTFPIGSCRVSVPSESLTTLQRAQVEGAEAGIVPEPAVRAYQVRMETPSVSDPRADADRLLKALGEQHRVACRDVDIEVLRGLSPKLRSWDWECRASVRGEEVVAVRSAGGGRHLGLAVDLGTTKIAGYLVDLDTGRTLAAEGIQNPQGSYGADVVSRISHAVKAPAARRALQKLAVGALNGLARGLSRKAGAAEEEIVDAVVVGNTAMHHLVLRLPVQQLARAPFVAAAVGPLDIKARDLGLRLAPGAYVHFPPVVAGFVGSDHVAMLLAAGLGGRGGPVVALDIGTNTEMSLVDGGRITSVSCASGPAFEGGHIEHGMSAAGGAIERLRLADGAVQYQTIDGAPPAGLCGSGVLDAVAQLFLAGVIDGNGRMSGDHPRVRTRNGQREFVLVREGERDGNREVTFTQRDVREVQLAKGAIRAGIEALLQSGGRSESEIEEVVIAGAFGSYIDLGSAAAIGMLPSLPPGRFRQVGNAAGVGARMALASVTRRAEFRGIASRIRYLELSASPGFMRTFVRASHLGPQGDRTPARRGA